MIVYEFRQPTGDIARQLIALSARWMEEGCCNGMVANQESDLCEPLAVALDGTHIVGYAMGHFYCQEKPMSYIKPGSACFSLDELYVLPEYRSRGIGKNLYRMMEDKVRENCKYLTLATSTKNYKAVLNLYIEELGMDFHSAFLTKQI